MVKKARSVALSSGIVFLLLASDAGAEHRIGALAGASFASLAQTPRVGGTEIENRLGFLVGGVVDFSLGERFGVRLEPMYIEKGADLVIASEEGPGRAAAETVLGYIEVPALLRATVTSGRVQLYGLAGGALAFRTSAKGRTGSDIDADLDRLFETWDVALALGGGVGFDAGGARIFVEGRYSWGLRNLNPFGDDAEVSSSKNRGAQILAGVSFGLGR